MSKRKTLRRLHDYYSSIFFKKITLDHLNPSSRKGDNEEYNMFPFEGKRHAAWHTLFWNMTVFEVWEKLDFIHNLIMNPSKREIFPVWLKVCRLERGAATEILAFEQSKNKFISGSISAESLQKIWKRCFKNLDIRSARFFLRYKMLFMIFGVRTIDGNFLLSDDNFKKMLQKAAENPNRRRALVNCFGSEMVSCSKARAIFNEIMQDVGRQ